MEFRDGASVGVLEGEVEGLSLGFKGERRRLSRTWLGARLGRSEGLELGEDVGCVVGSILGLEEGTRVGISDGDFDGFVEGEKEGYSVGEEVGVLEGDRVRYCVGGSVCGPGY